MEHRFRIGYILVKPEELQGFAMASQQSGQAAITDRIQVNEMVLAKIAEADWEDNMKYLHHDLPLEQMEQLRQQVSIQKDGRGRDVGYTGGEFRGGMADGFENLGRRQGSMVPNLAGVA